ncbi:class I SAM-dependent methyltransferase [Streptomyces sp. NPDC052051]|uniref:class I SAM-dependent methyltransferase n=1 Tax=Streptomyces sp. NPDC052051 TaxID=3154649 RepID=UPI0034242DEA
MTISVPMPYVDLVSLVGETNRCPGGKRAISRLAHTMHLDSRHRVLEVGSNTGFTSIELAVLTGCRTDGIEINPAAVAEADRAAAQLPSHIGERVAFHVGDVRALPWGADVFDAVVCGGALGFVTDRPAAFAEIRRVLRPLGMVSITHLYYRSTPPLTCPATSPRSSGSRCPCTGGSSDWPTSLRSAGRSTTWTAGRWPPGPRAWSMPTPTP